MRTRAEMEAEVLRHLRDTDGRQWTAATDVRPRLQDAARWLWRALAADPTGHRCLRKYSTATALVANQEEYALPADCQRLLAVEVRWQDADTRWTRLRYCQPPAEAVRSGAAALFAVYGTAAGSLAWYDDCNQGDIRIWPYLTTVGEEKYRFRYVCRPTFPTKDAATFNDPGGTGTDTVQLPDACDQAVEYLAAALLSLEEMQDGGPIGQFGTLYRQVLASIVEADGGALAAPTTRYVRNVRGW